MERDLSVNADPTDGREPEDPWGWEGGTGHSKGPEKAPEEIPGQLRRQTGDQGPCLYLGPAGQRCTRPALEGGFCASHQTGAPVAEGPFGRPSRLMAALLAILGMLWPLLSVAIREILRWIHSH